MSERYSRQIVLQGFGAEGQNRLLKASVLVIGAGGLGCPALQYLAGAGVGRIGIIDGDKVSLSNLHRQVLYSVTDIGKLKVEVALQKLTAANPEIKIETFSFAVRADNCVSIVENYDFILDCSDNFDTRYLLDDACAMLNKPLIFAAVSGWEGQLAVFDINENAVRANYRDLFPQQPGDHEIPNCEENGVIGVLPGILGNMQAAEAIKLITGIGKPLINQLLNYNLLDQRIYTIDIVPAPKGSYTLPKNESELIDMHRHQNYTVSHEDVIEIDILEMNDLIGTSSTLVIDVRETYERPVLPEKHIQVPMSAFDSTLPTEINEQNIILICQHGIRSLAAAEKLKSRYQHRKNIYSLAGGIARWYR